MFIKMAECILSWNIAIIKIKVNMPHTRRIFSTCLQNAKGWLSQDFGVWALHSQKKKMTKSARSCSVLEEFPRCNDYLIAANDFSIGKSLEKSRVCLCVELLGFLFTPCSHSAPILFHFPSGFFSSFSSIIFSLPHTEQCEHYLVPLAA